MPRFFFHVQSRRGTLVDEEGLEKSLDEAMHTCVSFARDVMCADILEYGRLDLEQSIVLVDVGGQVVATVPFAQTVELRR